MSEQWWEHEGRVFIAPDGESRFDLDNEEDVSELFAVVANSNATIRSYEERATRREAQLASARADAGVLYGLLDWLLAEMPACDKDEARDYCVTHYTKHCAVEAKIAKARTALAIHVSLAGETTA